MVTGERRGEGRQKETRRRRERRGLNGFSTVVGNGEKGIQEIIRERRKREDSHMGE